MSKSVRIRRGTSLDHAQFTGAEGEITIDTTLDTVRVHDGVQPGGYPLLNTTKNAIITAPELVANKILYRNSFTNQSSFPPATDYPGMLAFSQSDSKAFISNGTAWVSFTQPSDLTGFVTGSVNTSNTSGTDFTLTQPKQGTNLVFKTIRAGTNISLAQDNTSVVITSASYSGSNTADGGDSVGIYKATDSVNHVLSFKSIRAGTGISIGASVSGNEINIDTYLKQAYNTVSVNGTLIPTTAVNNTLNLNSGTGVTVTGDAGTKTVSFNVNLTATNDSAQTGSSFLKSYSAGSFVFNKLRAGAGVVLEVGPAGEVLISAPQVGTVTDAANLAPPSPTSLGIYKQNDDGTLKFYNLSAGSNISISYDVAGNNLIIDAATGGSAGVGTVQTGTATYLAFYPSTGTAVGPIGSGAYWSSGDNTIHANITGTVSSLSNQTTTNLAEGTNLYYTSARFDTAFSAKRTTDLTEGTNLYFTDERAQDAVSTMLQAGNPAPSTATVTTTSVSSSTATLFFNSVSGIVTGMTVSGPGFPNGVTVQTIGLGNIVVTPAVYAPLGTAVTFTGGTTLTIVTTANATSTAVVSVNTTSSIATGWYITGVGISGQVTVQTVGSNSLTLTPGYNVSLASGVSIVASLLSPTGLTSVYDDTANSYTYRLDSNFVGNLVRNALSVIPNQGLSYDPVQGRFGLSGAVTSVNGYSGSVQLTVGDITGAAPIASPTFTGTPRVADIGAGASGFQIANKNYVDAAKLAVTGSPLSGLATIQALGNAINGDTLFYQTVATQIAGKLSSTGGTLTGNTFLSYTVSSGSDPTIAVNKAYVDGIALVQTVNSKQGNIVLNTDDILERVSPSPVNLYFTNTRARSAITLVTDNSAILSYAPVSGTFTWSTPNTDAIVEGSTNQYWTNTRSRGAMGINVVGGTNFASYSSSTGVYTFNASTDNLSQGTTNKFYTDTLARAAISLATNTGQTSALLTYNSSTGQFSINPNTDRLTEGVTNLFYLDSRARASVNAAVTTSTAVSTGNVFTYNSTTGVFTFNNNTNSFVEGASNQFFTQARARLSISATGSINYDSATGIISYTTPTTDGITEGTTNKYYLDSRARAAHSAVVTTTSGLTTASALTYSSSTGAFTFNANTDNIAEGTTNKFASLSRVAGLVSLANTVTDGAIIVGSVSASGSTGVQTYTFSNYGSTPFAASSTVYITGFGTAGYNGVYTVLASPAPSATSFSVTGSTTGASSGGTVTNGPLLKYDNTSGVTTFNNSTDSLREGANSLYYTNARARAAVGIASGYTGVITYSTSTGLLTPAISVNNTNIVYTPTADGSTAKTLDTIQNIGQAAVPKFANQPRYTVPANANLGTSRVAMATSQTINLAAGYFFEFQRDTGVATTTTVSFTNTASVFAGAALSLTGASTSGTTATLTFSTQATAPYQIGSTIFVTGVSVAGYNGTWTVTACGVGSVSYVASSLSAGTGGTVQANATYVEVLLAWYNNTAPASVTFSPSNIKFTNGSTPTWTLTAGKRDFLKIFSTDGGTTWYEAWRSLNM